MSPQTPELIQPTLIGIEVELQPLRLEHKMVLLEAAADGELWNLKVTIVPSPETRFRSFFCLTTLRMAERG
ncbi:MAG: hypothetical protein V4568_13990, partial [Pseudomonadota bacterium]